MMEVAVLRHLIISMVKLNYFRIDRIHQLTLDIPGVALVCGRIYITQKT